MNRIPTRPEAPAGAQAPAPSLNRAGSVALGAALTLAVSLLIAAPALGQDQLTFVTGVTLEGEVKGLNRGTLDFDTEEMDVVPADWELVDAVASASLYEVTTVDGALYFGTLGGSGRTLVVTGPAGEFSLLFDDVVEILAIDQGFVARTSGYFDLAANLARANSLRSLLARGRAAYSGRKWAVSFQAERYNQSQEAVDDAGDVFEQQTSRTLVNSTGKRFFGGKLAATLAQQVEQNEELSLERRSLTTIGAEYNFIRNQSMELRLGGGAVLNSERYVGEDRTESGEINLSAGFDAFDIGDLSLYTSVNSYTNPADDRFRVDIDGRISWEIFSDFFVGFNVIEKFDSAPPEGAVERDYQYGFSVGWSWS